MPDGSASGEAEVVVDEDGTTHVYVEHEVPVEGEPEEWPDDTEGVEFDLFGEEEQECPPGFRPVKDDD